MMNEKFGVVQCIHCGYIQGREIVSSVILDGRSKLAFLQMPILVPIITIGLITFLLSLSGFYFGCGLGRVFGNKIKIVEGPMLIAIGLRILLEHIL